jgi:hypothetical protein
MVTMGSPFFSRLLSLIAKEEALSVPHLVLGAPGAGESCLIQQYTYCTFGTSQRSLTVPLCRYCSVEDLWKKYLLIDKDESVLEISDFGSLVCVDICAPFFVFSTLMVAQ